ncbi:MAG: shikimate dehydrogenase [Desulfobacterales bacterium]|jgi:shikimate dehydrogenase
MIDADTSLFGLIGNPVAHSLSPLMHNQAFAATGCNAVYLAFCVSDPRAAIESFKALNVKGLSVTLPHKVAVMEYLDDIDPTAAGIGAVNTIVHHNGRLIGYNTDCQGAIKALQTRTTIDGKSVAIIGAGGAARAVGFGLATDAGCLTILNRTRQSGERLAADLQAEFLPLDEFRPYRYDILINTTPVGMHPHTDASPIGNQALSAEMVVMDIVYNPLNTRLLKDAAANGCQTINGIDMFVFQGAQQFELWIGKKAPVEVMRQAVLQALQTNS